MVVPELFRTRLVAHFDFEAQALVTIRPLFGLKFDVMYSKVEGS